MEYLASAFADFHFLRPALLLALIPALALFLLLRFLQGQQSSWDRAIEPGLLPYLLDRTRTPRQNRPLYGLLLIWTLGVVALAGPVWQQIPMPVQEREDALVVVMDLSLSMNATDLSPNRVTRARRKLVDILNTRRQEGLTALVVYAGDAHTVTPLTDDVETINNLVPALNPGIMPVLGSNPASGIRQALELLDSGGIVGARILLMTDGVEDGDLFAIQDLLAGSGHRLSVLGFGTEEGAPIPTGEGGFLRDNQNAIVIPRLERGRLQELAAAARGRYADAQLTDGDIDYLLDPSLFGENENLAQSEREFDNWYEAGPWLLLLVLPGAALAFRQGWLLALCLVPLLVLPAAPARAFEWRDLWQTRDQQASEAFEQESYERAAGTFENARWRAAASYRSGNYERVLDSLAGLDDPEANYNRGNALAHLQRYEEALEAYDQTLAQQPGHEDARHNREIVAQLLEQQQQEQQQQQQQNSSGENQDQQQDPQQGEQQNQQQDQQQNQDQQQQQEGEQQQQGQQQDQQQDQQSQQQEQQGEQEEEGENEEDEQQPPQQQQASAEGSRADAEEEQSMQQWLQRIPDDPAELLRNKFEYQTMERVREQLRNPGLAAQPPQEKTW